MVATWTLRPAHRVRAPQRLGLPRVLAALAGAALLAALAGVTVAWSRAPSWNGGALRGRVAVSSGGLIAKLRKKASRPAPPLNDVGVGSDVSSALPPGSPAPEIRARIHAALNEKPELLEAVASATELNYMDMGPDDAADLADLQGEWFPEACYPDGAPWCAALLADPGVVAIKATLPDDPERMPAGIFVALGTRSAIEKFTSNATVETLRQELTIPRYIPWDNPTRRELGYVLSVGVVGELRKRGVAAELLRQGLERLQSEAPNGVRAVALDLADYNAAAMRCYEAAGFRKLKEKPEAYSGVGRRTYSSFLYGLFPAETSSS